MPGNTKSGRLGQNTKTALENKKRSTNEVTFTRPSTITKKAKKYWNRMFPILSENGELADKDFFAFERLCILYGQWYDLEKVLKKEGLTYEARTDRGSLVIRERPEAKLLLQMGKEIKDLEHKFGLTPLDGKAIKWKKKKESVRDKYGVSAS